MVLEALSCLASMFLSAGCIAVLQGGPPKEYRAAAYTFSIDVDAGRCVLNFTGVQHSGRLTLAPEAPCEFVQTDAGELRSFRYDDVGIEAVLIVTGTQLTAADRQTWKVPDGVFCGKTAQGVLVRPEGVLVSKEVMRGGIVCATTGVDEKRFYQFAHPLKPRE
jgi:hypothetical protein